MDRNFVPCRHKVLDNRIHFETQEQKEDFVGYLNDYGCFPLHFIKEETPTSILLSCEPRYRVHDCSFLHGPKFTLKRAEKKTTRITMYSSTTHIFFFLSKSQDINDFLLYLKISTNRGCIDKHYFEKKNDLTLVTKPCSDCSLVGKCRLEITIE
jgi:hypothetical protein